MQKADFISKSQNVRHCRMGFFAVFAKENVCKWSCWLSTLLCACN